MNSITPVLIEYWQRLPAHTPASRRQHLESACNRVRCGDATAEALVPFALGDVDDELVYTATSRYLEVAADPVRGHPEAVDDALEWIRRDLALNRGAVFAALLSRGESKIDERLACLRLTLSQAEVATVCRAVEGNPSRSVEEFLSDWRELLDAART